MVIQLADKRILIENIYPYLNEYCKDYLVSDDGEVDFAIHVTEADIEYERAKAARENAARDGVDRCFSDDYLETLAVYRKIAEWMPLQDTLLLHGSVVAVDGRGYMFTAKSGTGKSTHSGLWMEFFGDRAAMVNDDKPLLKVKNGFCDKLSSGSGQSGSSCFDDRSVDGSSQSDRGCFNKKLSSASDLFLEGKAYTEVFAYGTPWDGKHRLSTNMKVPLAGICILHRGGKNRIEPADVQTIYPTFVSQSYRPSEKESMSATFRLIDKILGTVPIYNLYCNMDIQAAVVAYDGMNKT